MIQEENIQEKVKPKEHLIEEDLDDFINDLENGEPPQND
jgi:hypothetical protein